MLEGFKSLLASEKALAAGALIICSTVLVIQGLMQVTDWQTYTRDIFIVYVSGKTVQGAVTAITESKTRKAGIEAIASVEAAKAEGEKDATR